MKIVEKVVKINKGLIKVGQIVEMEDTLSCDKFRAIVTKVSDFNLEMLRLKDLQEIVLPAEQLDHYEVRFMQLGYVQMNPRMSAKSAHTEDLANDKGNHKEGVRKENACEYGVFQDLLKQLAKNNAMMSRGVK